MRRGQLPSLPPYSLTTSLTSLPGTVHAAVVLRLNKMAVCRGAESWEKRGGKGSYIGADIWKEGVLQSWHLPPKDLCVFLSFTRTAKLLWCQRRQAFPSPAQRSTSRLNRALIRLITEAGEGAGPGTKGALKKCHCCVLEVRGKLTVGVLSRLTVHLPP